MAWKMIAKTGSFCLMLVFLATGAIANDDDFRQDVKDAFTAANDENLIQPPNPPFSDLLAFVDDESNTDGEVWTLYVNTFNIIEAESDLMPNYDNPGSPYCVHSEGANISCNNSGS